MDAWRSLPTAKQLVVLGHDTPHSTSTYEVTGLRMIDQRVPSQRSTTAWLPARPTAKQLDVRGHDTPNSDGPFPPPVTGLDMIAQVLPFQRSISAVPEAAPAIVSLRI